MCICGGSPETLIVRNRTMALRQVLNRDIDNLNTRLARGLWRVSRAIPLFAELKDLDLRPHHQKVWPCVMRLNALNPSVI